MHTNGLPITCRVFCNEKQKASPSYSAAVQSVIGFKKEDILANIFSNIPSELPNEIFEDIILTDKLRVERIISNGHTSPDNGWYDQSENEWVMVLSGYGVIEYVNGDKFTLKQGDYLHIKANEKHRVIETSANETTVWLAIFY